jgi:hypothetical protein
MKASKIFVIVCFLFSFIPIYFVFSENKKEIKKVIILDKKTLDYIEKQHNRVELHNLLYGEIIKYASFDYMAYQNLFFSYSKYSKNKTFLLYSHYKTPMDIRFICFVFGKENLSKFKQVNCFVNNKNIPLFITAIEKLKIKPNPKTKDIIDKGIYFVELAIPIKNYNNSDMIKLGMGKDVLMCNYKVSRLEKSGFADKIKNYLHDIYNMFFMIKNGERNHGLLAYIIRTMKYKSQKNYKLDKEDRRFSQPFDIDIFVFMLFDKKFNYNEKNMVYIIKRLKDVFGDRIITPVSVLPKQFEKYKDLSVLNQTYNEYKSYYKINRESLSKKRKRGKRRQSNIGGMLLRFFF